MSALAACLVITGTRIFDMSCTLNGPCPKLAAIDFCVVLLNFLLQVLGSAKLVLETKKHPGELKDMVTSPAGNTKIKRPIIII